MSIYADGELIPTTGYTIYGNGENITKVVADGITVWEDFLSIWSGNSLATFYSPYTAPDDGISTSGNLCRYQGVAGNYYPIRYGTWRAVDTSGEFPAGSASTISNSNHTIGFRFPTSTTLQAYHYYYGTTYTPTGTCSFDAQNGWSGGPATVYWDVTDRELYYSTSSGAIRFWSTYASPTSYGAWITLI